MAGTHGDDIAVQLIPSEPPAGPVNAAHPPSWSHVRRPNDRLRAARLKLPSPSRSGRCTSRQELADLVNRCLAASGVRGAALDAAYLGKLERGEHRWPSREYRSAFRMVLGAATDSELGFFIVRRQRV
jgi:hypothetical protein